jgi:hypothetical protein
VWLVCRVSWSWHSTNWPEFVFFFVCSICDTIHKYIIYHIKSPQIYHRSHNTQIYYIASWSRDIRRGRTRWQRGHTLWDWWPSWEDSNANRRLTARVALVSATWLIDFRMHGKHCDAVGCWWFRNIYASRTRIYTNIVFSLPRMCALIVVMQFVVHRSFLLPSAACSWYLVLSKETLLHRLIIDLYICWWIIGLQCKSYGYVGTKGFWLLYCIVVL